MNSDDLNDGYKPKYKDTSDQFHSIFRLVRHLDGMIPANFRLLVFNGDVDVVCNFLGTSWHMERVATRAQMTAGERTAWRFRDQLAGFVQNYSLGISPGNTLALDVLVIKVNSWASFSFRADKRKRRGRLYRMKGSE